MKNWLPYWCPPRLIYNKGELCSVDSLKSITAMSGWDKTRLIFDQSSKLVILELLNYNYFTADRNEPVLGCATSYGCLHWCSREIEEEYSKQNAWFFRKFRSNSKCTLNILGIGE